MDKHAHQHMPNDQSHLHNLGTVGGWGHDGFDPEYGGYQDPGATVALLASFRPPEKPEDTQSAQHQELPRTRTDGLAPDLRQRLV